MLRLWFLAGLCALTVGPAARAQTDPTSGQYIRENYTWQHHQIPMRDGRSPLHHRLC